MNYKKAILVALMISVFVLGAVSTASAASTKATLKVSAPKVTNEYKKSQAFKVTVKNKKTGKAMNSVKVNIKVYTNKKYKTYNVKTNKKGIATINTKKLTKGTHKVIIKIKATKKYKKASAKSTIKIQATETTPKEKIKTHFESGSGTYVSIQHTENGVIKGAYVTLNLVDAKGNILHKPIKASMRRWDYDAFDWVDVGDVVTGQSGNKIHVECDKWGADQIFISFAGDENYEACDYKIKLTNKG